ncbi:MAG: C40 family peptidase [Chitinophagales bacterium]|nr:C40 family peptidase [Chitinophagales bacterium]
MTKTLVLGLITFLSVSLYSQSSLYYNPNEQVDKDCDNSLITTFSKYFAKKEEPKKETSKSSSFTAMASDFYSNTVDNVISVGKTFLGIPYRWGGTTENGFDCSGFIRHIFDWFGIRLPRTSREMAHVGSYVSRSELQKGDLIFFSGRNMNNGVIGHIGIVVEVTNEAVKMMHSSSSKGVHIEELDKSEYFSKRYMTARRLPLNEMQSNKN